ncbi:hypothetical protein EDB84DRAFT_1611684 [Lactarius hengduanensis]|nr:hypothetical protein EDB84DRAFT_1611684 [Lactarius hengduanensis]
MASQDVVPSLLSLLAGPLSNQQAHYYDNVSANLAAPSPRFRTAAVELDYLRKHGLTLSTVPLDTEGGWEPVVDKMVNERGWDNRDTINVTKEGLGDHSEQMLDKFFTVFVTHANLDLAMIVVYKVMVISCSSGRHMHDDAEIRYILSSSGHCQWDMREYLTDRWIRVQILPGDSIVIPARFYHHFTPDELYQVKALRFTNVRSQDLSYDLRVLKAVGVS